MNDLKYETGASMSRLKRDEGLAFRRLADTLDGIAVPSVEATRSAHTVRRVWTALIADLGSEGNAYPTPLKVELIGIGIAMIRDAEAILDGEAEAAPRLATLCRTLSEGLLRQPSKVAS